MSSSDLQQPQERGKGLSPLEYTGYALGDTASNFFFQMFNIFLSYYYIDVWGISPAALLWMIPIVKLFDAFNDPIMGIIADRTNSRWGKFRPYLLFGAIPYGVCGCLMFLGPEYDDTGKLIYAYVTYSLMLLSYTVINVPYSSLMGVLSPSSGVRATASSFRFVGAFTGGFLISLLVRPLVAQLGGDDEILGFQRTMAIFAVISIVLFWITFATTKERVQPPKKQNTNAREELGELVKNFPWIMLLIASVLSTTFVALRSGSTIFYFKYVVEDVGNPLFTVSLLSYPIEFDRTDIFLASGMLAQIVGTLTLSFIADKVDKKISAGFLCVVTGLSFFSFFFLPKDQYVLLILVNALGWLCMGPTSALTWALYSDVADYGEWKFGRRSTGLVFSASLFSIKTGITVGTFLLPLFLALFHYVKPEEGVDFIEQTDTAKLGILLAFSIVPGIIAFMKGIALLIYPLNQKRVKEIEQALIVRRDEATDEMETV